jgi:putative glutamine amidotransferase
MRTRPLIGVTTSEVRVAEHTDPLPEGDPPRVELALGVKYTSAVEAGGGVPVVIPPMSAEAIGALLDGLDGVCLSGGPDLHPTGYGERPHPKLGPTEIDLDRFELAVARAADERGLPILGICRGAQALNVARGGTLHQHVPDVAGSDIEHRQTLAGDRLVHTVEIEPGSLLARTLGRRRARVNSFHHQAVKRIGRGLRPVAWAPDGVVEAVESRTAHFVLGVQWHAECLVERPTQARLFRAFVDAAREETAAPRLKAA